MALRAGHSLDGHIGRTVVVLKLNHLQMLLPFRISDFGFEAVVFKISISCHVISISAAKHSFNETRATVRGELKDYAQARYDCSCVSDRLGRLGE